MQIVSMISGKNPVSSLRSGKLWNWLLSSDKAFNFHASYAKAGSGVDLFDRASPVLAF